ncbi:MAG: alpha/beta hydrolase [Crocinitomicaceae bacterium]
MTENSITVKKKAAFSTYGNPGKAKHIIFALHGYGQLSRFFIKKFQGLGEDYYIVAPEGLHRFYLEGSSGRVGASWMTKEQREDDIKDYIQYLNKLWKEISEMHSFKKKILLGFSQGGATASRWHQHGAFNANSIVMWGAIFPPDLPQNWEVNFQSTENYFVVGDKDPYYDIKKIDAQIKFFEEKSVNFTTLVFNGKHEIDQSTLLKICQ